MIAPAAILGGFPILAHQPIRLGWPGTVLLCLIAAWFGFCFVLARFESRHRRRPFSFLRATRDGLRLLILLAPLAVALLWLRSYDRTDELLATIRHDQHHLTSYRGGINFIVVRGRDLALPPSYGTFSRIYDYWSLKVLKPTQAAGRGGFAVATGTVHDEAGIAYPYRVVRVPHWAILTLSAALAAIPVARFARRHRAPSASADPNDNGAAHVEGERASGCDSVEALSLASPLKRPIHSRPKRPKSATRHPLDS